MPVIIQQLEHSPATAETPTRGTGGDGNGGGASAAPSAAELIQALRRESARRARLWAD